MIDPVFDYQFRLILIGDSTVGKSSLLKCFTDGKFFDISDPTVGVDFYARLIEVRDGAKIKLQIWDTAGQERFRSITQSYYLNSVGALVIFDVTSRNSLDHIPMWIMEAKRHIQPHEAVFILVGTKIDLEAEREVSQEDGEKLAEFYGIQYIETSALRNFNVENAFSNITQTIYNKILSGEYKLLEDWAGIKPGFKRSAQFQQSIDLREAEATNPNFCC